ncbi:MAG: hypothetical protein KBT11_05915 [Treponema sp.]|nr:hypothetical protein [Candidatus Treponema equifaecale]
MILAFVSSFFCIFNIVLWIFFLSKYKKFFSTDEIIESTRAELEQMIDDVNRNASRNIDIIEDRIKELRSVIAEADRHLAVAQVELKKQENLSVFQQRLNVEQRNFGNANASVAEKYRRNSRSSHSDDTYNITAEGSKHVQPSQPDLFSQVGNEIVSGTGTTFIVENHENPVTHVPVIGPNITYAENPVEPKKSFSQLVKDLHTVGHSVEEIATELGSSITEVQLVLDMDF